MRGHGVRKQTVWQRALPLALVLAALAFTAAAGLAGRGARAALVPAETDAAAADAGAPPQTAQARRREAPPNGPATEEILRAPEVALNFENVAGAPVSIVTARARVITREQLRRADAEGADSEYDEGEPGVYVTLPTVMLTNVSDKTVIELGVGLTRAGGGRAVMGQPVTLRPGETHTLTTEWRRRNLLVTGDAADITLRVFWVTFEDGRQWGVRPPPPPPPPAPPPPGREGRVGANATAVPEGAIPRTAVGEGVGGGGVIVGAAGGSSGGTSVGAAAGPVVARGGSGRGGHPQVVSMPAPNYPEIAKAAGAEGEVEVEVTVNEEGRVISARAVRGHPLLQQAAVEAARKAQFKPTLLSGEPVKVLGVLTYKFTRDQ